jgi:hypothetical protein
VLYLGPYDPVSLRERNTHLNHGESFGLAIDVSASQVVYWAEGW